MIRNIPICRYISGCLVLLMCMLSIVNVPGSSAADSDAKRESVTIDVVDEPLNQVLARISEASGYEIVFDEEWGNEPVSLTFKDEPLEKALNRVLANLNHAVVWYEEERRIKIFISGKSNPPEQSIFP